MAGPDIFAQNNLKQGSGAKIIMKPPILNVSAKTMALAATFFLWACGEPSDQIADTGAGTDADSSHLAEQNDPGQIPTGPLPEGVSPTPNRLYLTIDPDRRDDLRHYLLKRGFDTKTTDMSDCTALAQFRQDDDAGGQVPVTKEASILEICVYPVISKDNIRQLAADIREWARTAKS